MTTIIPEQQDKLKYEYLLKKHFKEEPDKEGKLPQAFQQYPDPKIEEFLSEFIGEPVQLVNYTKEKQLFKFEYEPVN